MAGRLFPRSAPSPADTNAAMMAVISLMILVLPMVLMTTSAQKLTALPLGIPGPSETLPPEPPGAVESLHVERTDDGYLVTADVRKTDVLATSGDTEHRVLHAGDLRQLQQVLGTLKSLDPSRKRITLEPAPTTTTDEVVRWMDAVRAGPSGELYPNVILEARQVAPPAAGGTEEPRAGVPGPAAQGGAEGAEP